MLGDPNPLDNSYIHVVHLLHNTANASRSQQHRRRQMAWGGGSRHQGQGSSETQGQSSSRPASGGDGTQQQQQGQTGGKTVVHTRPLVEVFGVIVQPAYFRSIAVFDEKRGQIIYNGVGRLYKVRK
jgi:hypothetical protein